MHLLANLIKDHRDRPLCARLLPVAPGGCKHPRRGEGNQRISRPRLKGSSRESSSAGSSWSWVNKCNRTGGRYWKPPVTKAHFVEASPVVDAEYSGMSWRSPRNSLVIFYSVKRTIICYLNAYWKLKLVQEWSPWNALSIILPNWCPLMWALRSSLVAEKIGNVGYCLNWSVWVKIHGEEEFCSFDEYN